jgi:uncharacterized damage-inducible protein DinB
MTYPKTAISAAEIPEAKDASQQHLLDIYVSEINKVFSVWSGFQAEHLAFRPHPKSSSTVEIMNHQLLSERRFFGEFLGTPEPAAADVLPPAKTSESLAMRLVELVRPRLGFLADQLQPWWYERVPFFDVERQRIWVFWRRILHTAHHRTQLTVYARLLNLPVQPVYGPTADITWNGADPTTTIEAAARREASPQDPA